MSMLSAQCDELRATAESVGMAMPQAATLMMEAADTITELRETLQRRNKQFEGMTEMWVERRVENAKLRELVDYMTPIAWYAASERERDRMRELGVTE